MLDWAHANGQSPKDRDDFEIAEFLAKIERLGLWADKNSTTPWDFARRIVMATEPHPPSKYDLKTNVERVYFHYPYIAKTSVVDIIQYIERFIRFELYPDITMFGLSDHRHWERLVRNYLEEVHSFIDLQRKTFSAVEKFLDKDLAAERNAIIDPIPTDSLIIQELRRQVHHESNNLIFICVAATRAGGIYPAIPLVTINRNWFSSKEIIDRVDDVMDSPEKLAQVFGTHCDHFVPASNKIGNMLLEHLGYPPAKQASKYDFKSRT